MKPGTWAVKHLLKRGALLAAANWQTVAIQFVAETTFQVLLAVPIVGAAVLVAVLLGGDLGELLQGSLRQIFTTIAGALLSEPLALVAFVAALAAVLLVAWITIVNMLYLLTQIAMAVEGVGLAEGCRATARFIRAERRELFGVFLIVVALVIAATLVSALAWSGVGLIAFV